MQAEKKRVIEKGIEEVFDATDRALKRPVGSDAETR